MKIKNILIGLLFLLAFTLTLPNDAIAQGKGKGGPPSWAPAHGYRAKTRHVYFPDHNFYFDVQKNVYIYLNGGKWQVGIKLPSLYANVNMKLSAKVELELNTNTPQNHNATHKVKYKVKKKGVQVKSNNGPVKVKTGGHGNGHGKGKKK